MARAWVIKLGSGGLCVPFCERHGIVGLGWKEIRHEILARASREELLAHVTEACPFYENQRQRSAATGQLYRFARECSVGDLIVYYDPPNKHVVIAKVTSELLTRDFEMDDATDIWHFRKVEIVRTIPILDFYGALKGKILGPKMSFWELRPFADVNEIAKGNPPGFVGASDPELEAAYLQLRQLVLRRAESLDSKDWEWVVVDYFKAQGAHVDERAVGGNRAIIDAEARFYHGELGEEVWRIQVKRYQNKPVEWAAIEKDFKKIGDDSRFCFVSVYGFTKEALAKAAEEEIRLLEAADFTQFLLSDKVRPELRRKLMLPTF